MPVEQLIENCLNNNSNSNRRPLIIDTDADVDDLWAIHYLVNVPTIDVLAITTVGNAFSGPFYSASNILRLLDLIGCKNHIPVAYGLSLPLLSPGWKLPDTMLNGINTYLTAPTCLNQSAANIFIQPSPFEAVELIKLTLKYSIKPVDILVLGTMTNIAAAITEDRSIIPKIGTLYFSGQ
ncbi:unnamed protein product [Rotaria sordida]|uniref:Inosine/uridine-preferring nucleoside hydrolase domain-containing protein n=1 Tax=Rotaria sordida TaxID=392033 RepID=A0A813WHL9_9BILA|nr:unnamed protein product [Rotaria sordida]